MSDTPQTQAQFDRDEFLKQVQADINKSQRESLKAKIKGLLNKRSEAVRAVAVVDEEIDREISLFERGLS